MKKGMAALLGVFIAAGMIFSGCGRSGPSRFYMLEPLSASESGQIMSMSVPGPAIGVGPISIPDYLDRPHLVIRKSPHQLEVAEFEKWAGSLKQEIPRILAENLSRLLRTDRVSVFPWGHAAPIQYQVTVDMVRLDADETGSALLKARWAVLDSEGRKTLVMRRAEIREPAGEAAYAEMVSAQSRALGILSADIADALIRLKK